MLEDKNTEFKREYVEDIKKTLVAFANTDGGNIYIGIDDDGNAVEINSISQSPFSFIISHVCA